MARKTGESMIYRRLTVPKINEKDPADNPQAGDLWIDFSVDPPVVNLLDKLLAPIVIGGGAALTPPVTITGDGSTVTLTVGQPRGAGFADALDIKDTTDSIFLAQFSTATNPSSGANFFLQNILGSTPALIVKQRLAGSGTQGLVQFQNSSGVANFMYDAFNGTVLVGNVANLGGFSNLPNFAIVPGSGQTLDTLTVYANAAFPATKLFSVDVHGNTTYGDGTVAPTAGAGQIALGATTATSASAGANGAVPAQVAGYWIVNIAGTSRKIPFFAT